MNTFLEFVRDLNTKIGIALPQAWTGLTEVQVAQRFLARLNEYFYQTYKGIGTTSFEDEELQYFSEFHKFWEVHHEEVLGAYVDNDHAAAAARLLDAAVRKNGRHILDVTWQTYGLSPKAIAQVRFFTANQDWRRPPEDQYKGYNADPDAFDENEVADDPQSLLKTLRITALSQTDKRIDYARNAAQFLIHRKLKAFDIAEYYGGDAARIRQALVSEPNMGYGAKKANMFLRDMIELNVWAKLANVEQIDVATDTNIMKIALRTGVLGTQIPLLSSLLDIFCHQYGHIYDMTALAWREVWKHWRQQSPQTAPRSPCMLDFLLYRIGREYCKQNLVEYRCEVGHSFHYFGARLRKCRVCAGKKRAVQVIARFLPCQVAADRLPHEDGEIMLSDENLLRTFGGFCIFEDVCNPKAPGFRPLDPPKSISVKGETGWTSAYADRERGGGGLMS